MPELEVIEIDGSMEREWDELVIDSPCGTIFQRYFWLRICEKHLGGKLRILGVLKEDELVGGCSLFEGRTGLGMRFADSICGLTPYGGVLVSKDLKEGQRLDRSCESVLDVLSKRFRDLKLSRVRITHSPDFIDVRPFTWAGWRTSVMYAYYVPLENNSFSRTVRRGVKKAEGLGYGAGSIEIDEVHRMLLRTFEEDGADTSISNDFLKDMIEAVTSRGMGTMNAVASPEGETACASVFLWEEKRPYYWICVNDPRSRECGARFMLDLETFSEMEKKGFGEINMMSGNLPRLAEFAMNYRPILVPYYRNETSTLRWRAMHLPSQIRSP